MATTRISDVIIPEVYLTYQAENDPIKSAFFESGVIVNSPLLNELATAGGETFNIPFWNDLDSTVEANLSSSDPAVVATAQKITTSKQIGRKVLLNQFYSNAHIASELAGSSANQQVRNRFGTYWLRQWQTKLIAATNGVLADNVANDSGDMVNDVAVEIIASQTALTRFSRANFTTAVFTMGDAAQALTAIAVHSFIYKQMVDLDDIDFIPDSNGKLTIPTYMGLRVIVDDGLTVTAGTTSGFKYTSVIFGAGAFGYGNGTPEKPVSLTTEELQGNGGGVDYLGERKTWLIHPFGFQSLTTPAAEGGFTNAELATAAVWDRVVDRKSVPMAFLITN